MAFRDIISWVKILPPKSNMSDSGKYPPDPPPVWVLVIAIIISASMAVGGVAIIIAASQ